MPLLLDTPLPLSLLLLLGRCCCHQASGQQDATNPHIHKPSAPRLGLGVAPGEGPEIHSQDCAACEQHEAPPEAAGPGSAALTHGQQSAVQAARGTAPTHVTLTALPVLTPRPLLGPPLLLTLLCQPLTHRLPLFLPLPTAQPLLLTLPNNKLAPLELLSHVGGALQPLAHVWVSCLHPRQRWL
ncbi:hypothetical protein V8C86DRAFT_2679299 [Haematococcus lacustris]